VWPLGAQVARTEGNSETPVSSSNTISACWRRAPFQLRPALLDPLLDSFVATFQLTPRRSLPGPAQLLPQEIPDIARVVGHASHLLDDLRRASQRRHVTGAAIDLGTLLQRPPYFPQLCWAELARPSGASLPAQRRTATLSPHLSQVGADSVTYAQLRGDLCRDHPFRNRSAAGMRRWSIAFISRRGRGPCCVELVRSA
jgi:hypothetical protein